MDNNGNIETESNTSTIQPRNASHIYQEFLHCLGDVQAVAMFLLGSKWRSQKGFSCTGNWKAYFISHGVPKCAIFEAARSHLHIWLMENGSFLDVFYGDLSIDHCFFHSYVKYPHCMYLRFLLHDSNLTSAPNGYIYINLVSYQHSNEINPWHVGP